MIQKQKRTLFIASGALAAVLVMVLIVLWVTLWAPPSKQDFKDARATVKAIDDSYEKIDDAYRKYFQEVRFGFAAGKTREVVIAESAAEKKTYVDVMNSHQAAITTFEESKVYKDPDVASAYDKFIAKDKLYVANVDGFIYPFVAFRSSLDTCKDVYDVAKAGVPTLIAKQHKEASKDCLADHDEAASSKAGPFADYGKKSAAHVRERQVVFDKTAREEISLEDSIKKLRELATKYGGLDPLGEVNKNAKAINFADELDALKKILDRKAAQ
jgi:hypothetical protein